jgi:glyoxylase-like metal-dependent hydrolase (beta-lactamase superfamily II)
MRSSVFLLVLCITASALDTPTVKERSTAKLAEGIYTIRHPDAPDGFPNSNTTVIIGDKGVLVVDSCLLPSQAKLDIAQIRQWTPKPVLYVVNTHWHFDHTLGNSTYVQAFPAAQIIAQRATAKTIAAFNPGAVERYPKREQRFRQVLDSGKNPDGTPLTEGDRKDYEQAIAGLAPVVAEMKGTVQAMPTLVFDEALDVDLGGRIAQVRFLGKGNTAGDTIVYLPKEKIISTGDLVVSPAPYLFGGFPVEFVPTLERLMEFDAQTIVPGHGQVMHDWQYARMVHDLQRDVEAQLEREINLGKTLDEVKAEAPNWQLTKDWTQRYAQGDKDIEQQFASVYGALITAAYNELKMR